MASFKGPHFEFPLGKRTYIMGILNITPDSFSDGGKYIEPQAAVAHALQMQKDGADMIDIGAESTRPGHQPVSQQEEIERLTPVLKALKGKLNIPVSIDTMKPGVAEAAAEYGAAIINDVNGFLAEGMAAVVAEKGLACVIMHPGYAPYPNGVAAHVKSFLKEAAMKAEKAGIPKESICLDPGVGFGKDFQTNLELIRTLERAKVEGYAYLLGISRKSVIGLSTGETVAANRDAGTIAAHTISIMKGADIIRVHDVRGGVQAAKLTDAILRNQVES